MKRFITTIMVLCLVLGVCTTSTFAASSSSGYVKVKKATYAKYKKAYNKQDEYKKKIKKLEKKLELATEEAEKQESINGWLWMNVKSLGLSYKEKVWTVPTSFPSKFMVNGATYTVTKEE